MTLPDHIFKKSSDLTGRVKANHPEKHVAMLCDHRWCGSGDVSSLIYQVILQDHVIQGHLTLWVAALHGKLPKYQVWWL